MLVNATTAATTSLFLSASLCCFGREMTNQHHTQIHTQMHTLTTAHGDLEERRAHRSGTHKRIDTSTAFYTKATYLCERVYESAGIHTRGPQSNSALYCGIDV